MIPITIISINPMQMFFIIKKDNIDPSQINYA